MTDERLSDDFLRRVAGAGSPVKIASHRDGYASVHEQGDMARELLALRQRLSRADAVADRRPAVDALLYAAMEVAMMRAGLNLKKHETIHAWGQDIGPELRACRAARAGAAEPAAGGEATEKPDVVIDRLSIVYDDAARYSDSWDSGYRDNKIAEFNALLATLKTTPAPSDPCAREECRAAVRLAEAAHQHLSGGPQPCVWGEELIEAACAYIGVRRAARRADGGDGAGNPTERVVAMFTEARLTHPMLGFKHSEQEFREALRAALAARGVGQ